MLVLLASGAPAQAATFTVSNTDDDGPGSLRDAIAQANATDAPDQISISTTGVIFLTTGRLVVSSDMTITGPGADALEVSGNDSDRVFEVGTSATAVTISGVTIADGFVGASSGSHAAATGTNGADGAVGGANGAPANVSTGDGTDEGGAGVANAGTLTLRDVRVTNNLVQAGSGGNAVATGGAGGHGGNCIVGQCLDGGAGGSATAVGGAGGDALGGGIRNTGTLRLERTVVTGNTVSAGSGGTSEARGGAGGSGGSFRRGGAGGEAYADGGPGGAARGGGVYNEATLTVRESTVSANNSTAGSGGRSESRAGNSGDAVQGTGGAGGRSVANAPGAGGAGTGAGIHNVGALTLDASTVAGNTASAGSGGDGEARGGNGGAGGFGMSGTAGGNAFAARAGAGGAAFGAGVANEGTARVVNATLSGNTATTGQAGSSATATPGSPGAASSGGSAGGSAGTATSEGVGAGGAATGGGLANGSAPTLTIRSATVAGNGAATGANLSSDGPATIVNTILAESRGGGANCAGSIASRGFNIDDGTSCGLGGLGDQSGVDPLLEPLADNGGPTRTRRPADGGPAIDRGFGDGLTSDARGSGRPSNFSGIANAAGGDGSDVGAVELVGDGLPDVGTPGGPAGSGPDGVAPTFASARLTNKKFAVDRKGPAEAAVRTAAAKKGTTFVYSLSEPARVVITIESKQKGRKVGRSCRKPSRSNRKRKRCIRWVRTGAFAHQSAAGANTKRFSGRIGRKALKPGSYRASLVATDAAGNASAAKRLTFKVVRR